MPGETYRIFNFDCNITLCKIFQSSHLPKHLKECEAHQMAVKENIENEKNSERFSPDPPVSEDLITFDPIQEFQQPPDLPSSLPPPLLPILTSLHPQPQATPIQEPIVKPPQVLQADLNMESSTNSNPFESMYMSGGGDDIYTVVDRSGEELSVEWNHQSSIDFDYPVEPTFNVSAHTSSPNLMIDESIYDKNDTIDVSSTLASSPPASAQPSDENVTEFDNLFGKEASLKHLETNTNVNRPVTNEQ